MNKAKYMICESPVCIGSPTVGTQYAYGYLKKNGLAALLGEKAVFCDFAGEKTAEEKLCDKRLIGLETVNLVNRTLRRNLLSAYSGGFIPVALGGDHSIVMASLAASAETYGAENIALIYIDAHTDINTEETTVTGRIHGMPVAQAMGLCTDKLSFGEKNRINLYGKNTYFIGAHSIDEAEYPIIKEQGATVYSPSEVKERGWHAVLSEVLEKTSGLNRHVSFDVDGIDGSQFKATGYTLDGGLDFEDVYSMIKYLVETNSFSSFDCVEYNPQKDADGDCLAKLLRVFALFAN